MRDDAPMPGTPVVPRLRTSRLLLREWRASDLEPFAALNADPAVAEFLSAPLTRAQSDALVGRIVDHWRTDGYALWAVERTGDGAFLGFSGLSVPAWAPEPTPEIGWRLAQHAWGRGYATEAAREVLRFAFEGLAFDALVSYTTVSNVRSRRVMVKLGMVRDPAADFDHPRLAPDHPLRPHVTYRLSRAAWEQSRAHAEPGRRSGMDHDDATRMLETIAAAFDRHDVEAIMAHFADDAVFEGPRGPEPWGTRFVGAEAIREAFAARFAGIPDARYRDDAHFVDGDRGASEWTLSGTTAEGLRIEVRGCDLWTFGDGRIVKKDSFWKIRTAG